MDSREPRSTQKESVAQRIERSESQINRKDHKQSFNLRINDELGNNLKIQFVIELYVQIRVYL
jgi:hypothetical protein